MEYINAGIAVSLTNEHTLKTNRRYIMAFGFGIKVHDVFDLNNNYFGSRISLFYYDLYNRKVNFVRLLDKQEAIDLSERIPPLFYSKISKAVDEGKDIFHSFKSHHIRYCILQRIKRIREYNSQRF
ncbi:MAG: hypothetical protein DRP55_03605 [Spirochaetes bacterium]|nr:MAG: hypothetical protein DRP55_03605 [Spirochaetota bacterium]